MRKRKVILNRPIYKTSITTPFIKRSSLSLIKMGKCFLLLETGSKTILFLFILILLIVAAPSIRAKIILPSEYSLFLSTIAYLPSDRFLLFTFAKSIESPRIITLNTFPLFLTILLSTVIYPKRSSSNNSN